MPKFFYFVEYGRDAHERARGVHENDGETYCSLLCVGLTWDKV